MSGGLGARQRPASHRQPPPAIALPARVWLSLIVKRRERQDREAEAEARWFRDACERHPRDLELAARYERLRWAGRL